MDPSTIQVRIKLVGGPANGEVLWIPLSRIREPITPKGAEKAWMRELFTALSAEAGYVDADRLGTQLHLLYEGAVVALTAGDQADAVDQARDAARRLLPDR